MKNVPIMML